MKKDNKFLERFDRDFRKYLNASIAFAEVQKPYRALDIEDEILWLKRWIERNTLPRKRKIVHLNHDNALTWCWRNTEGFLGDEGF